MKRNPTLWRRIIGAVVIGGLAGAAIRLGGVYPLHIASNSMAPSVKKGDVVVVMSVTQSGRQRLARGSIAVFRYPPSPSGIAIKRIVAVPGDVVQFARNYVRINGQEIVVQPMSAADPGAAVDSPAGTTVVPQGHYFILGDNTASSIDSRTMGLLAAEEIVGSVMVAVPLSAVW